MKLVLPFRGLLVQHAQNHYFVYVPSDLPAGVTDEEVHRFFSGWGQIADLFLADNGQYCLVHFQDR